jgi:hypothetical protein
MKFSNLSNRQYVLAKPLHLNSGLFLGKLIALPDLKDCYEQATLALKVWKSVDFMFEFK